MGQKTNIVHFEHANGETSTLVSKLEEYLPVDYAPWAKADSLAKWDVKTNNGRSFKMTDDQQKSFKELLDSRFPSKVKDKKSKKKLRIPGDGANQIGLPWYRVEKPDYRDGSVLE